MIANAQVFHIPKRVRLALARRAKRASAFQRCCAWNDRHRVGIAVDVAQPGGKPLRTWTTGPATMLHGIAPCIEVAALDVPGALDRVTLAKGVGNGQ